MSLRGFQQAVAELVTRDAVWNQAVQDLDGVLARFDLSDRERRRVAALVSQRGMHLNRQLYRANRAAPLLTLLPLSCFLLGGHLRAELDRFWAATESEPRFGVEALRFGEFVHQRLSRGELLVPALADTLAFEISCVQLQLPAEPGAAPWVTDRLRVLRFEYDPLPLLQRISAREPPPYEVDRGEFWLLLDARDGSWQIRCLDADVASALEQVQARPMADWPAETLAAAGVSLATVG